MHKLLVSCIVTAPLMAAATHVALGQDYPVKPVHIMTGSAGAGLDIVALAKGYGCPARRVTTREEVEEALTTAFASAGPTVIDAQVAEVIPKLV